MRKNTVTPMLKDCITQSLLLLLQEKTLDEISVKEIVEKAGVNRSTYYRNFRTKQDVIRHFFALRLDEYLSTVVEQVPAELYFTGMFASFLRHKDELILLDRLSLTYLLLEEMDERISGEENRTADAVQALYCHYHIGGVFNSFRLWLREDMNTAPEVLARQCMMILPKDFAPRLLKITKER